MKHYITDKNLINTKGEGQYILTTKDKKKVLKVVTYNGTESLVDQAQTKMTDIQVLLEPAMRNGLLKHSLQYAEDSDNIPSTTYQEALITVANAQQMFDDLPVNMRSRFNQNPKEFLEFTSNPANAQEMQKLGMLKGNDGLTATGAPSGAPTKTDMDGNGIPDAVENPVPLSV